MRILMATAAMGVLLAACSKDDGSVQYYNCGETPIKTQMGAEQLTLTMEDKTYLLLREVTQNGDVYKNDDDGVNVTFTPSEEGARVQIDRRRLPACTAVEWKEKEEITHFKAFGNEPGWIVEVAPGLVTAMRGTDGQTYAISRKEGEGLKGSYSLNDGDVKVSIKDASKKEPCRDTMSGQYFAHHVTMKFNGETFKGCGDSSPKVQQNNTPITGAVWVVEDIDGKGIIDRSFLNVRINDRGFINADTMCGRFAAPYTLEGNTITLGEEFKPIGSRVCRGEALEEQKTRFMDILANIEHYAYRLDGGMVMFTPKGQTITFRKR